MPLCHGSLNDGVHFIPLGHPWVPPGSPLGPPWVPPGSPLGPPWVPPWVPPGSPLGPPLGPPWVTPGSPLGPPWVTPGLLLPKVPGSWLEVGWKLHSNELISRVDLSAPASSPLTTPASSPLQPRHHSPPLYKCPTLYIVHIITTQVTQYMAQVADSEVSRFDLD